jgi:rhodanese-related sulfurtransferase
VTSLRIDLERGWNRRAACSQARCVWLCLLVALVLAGPAGAQQHVVLKESGIPQPVTPQALLRDLLAGRAPLVLDVRPPVHFARGYIPGAVNVPHKQVPGRWDEIAPYEEQGVVVYCQKGLRTRYAAHALQVEGMKRVGVLQGFMDEWERLGYPVSYPGQ